MALRETAPGHSSRHYLDMIHASCRRAMDIVSRLMTANQCRCLPGKLKPIVAIPVIENALNRIRAGLGPDIMLKIDCQHCRDLVRANPRQLEKVVEALCANACRAMESSGGVLTVGFGNALPDDRFPASKREVLRVSVGDTGGGIDAAHLDRIFDPYFTTQAFGRSAGLGLAEVLGIMAHHNGSVAVENRPGIGVTFHLFLPLASPQ